METQQYVVPLIDVMQWANWKSVPLQVKRCTTRTNLYRTLDYTVYHYSCNSTEKKGISSIR